MVTVYVKCTDGVITAIDSNIFISDTTEWIQIDAGTGDQFAHAQSQYLPLGLIDSNGLYNYKLVNGAVVERTEEDKQPELTAIANKLEVLELKKKLADTDYIAAKIAEGAATIEEYSTKIALRASWRSQINTLES